MLYEPFTSDWLVFIIFYEWLISGIVRFRIQLTRQIED